MSDANDAMLVLDVSRLLDESKAGAGAAKELASRYAAAKKRRAALVGKLSKTVVAAKGAARKEMESELAAFDTKQSASLNTARAELRTALLTRAQPHVIRLLKERGASVVMRAEDLVVFKREIDITAEVIAAVDLEGELKLKP